MTTIEGAQATSTIGLEPAAIPSALAAGSSSTAASTPNRRPPAYERFLELPVWVVLSVMWVAGATLLGSCGLVLYMVGSVLLRVAVVGSL